MNIIVKEEGGQTYYGVKKHICVAKKHEYGIISQNCGGVAAHWVQLTSPAHDGMVVHDKDWCHYGDEQR